MSQGSAKPSVITDELVMRKIHTIRGLKVMLDRDLAELYGVPTKALKQAVRRNMERFPEDFMFDMNPEELQQWRSQIVTSNPGDKMGLRHAPFCFTEHGVLMLSSVLNSPAAIAVNIQVIRVFTKMREVLSTHKELVLQLEKLRGTVSHNSRDINAIFNILKRMQEEERNRALLAQIPKKRPPIGFKKAKGGKRMLARARCRPPRVRLSWREWSARVRLGSAALRRRVRAVRRETLRRLGEILGP